MLWIIWYGRRPSDKVYYIVVCGVCVMHCDWAPTKTSSFFIRTILNRSSSMKLSFLIDFVFLFFSFVCVCVFMCVKTVIKFFSHLICNTRRNRCAQIISLCVFVFVYRLIKLFEFIFKWFFLFYLFKSVFVFFMQNRFWRWLFVDFNASFFSPHFNQSTQSGWFLFYFSLILSFHLSLKCCSSFI